MVENNTDAKRIILSALVGLAALGIGYYTFAKGSTPGGS